MLVFVVVFVFVSVVCLCMCMCKDIGIGMHLRLGSDLGNGYHIQYQYIGNGFSILVHRESVWARALATACLLVLHYQA